MQRFATLVSTVLGVSVALCVASADVAPFRFRIGHWTHPTLPGAAIYSRPRAGAVYSVLTRDGSVLFTNEAYAWTDESQCDGSVRTVWYITPPPPLLPNNVSAHVVLVETSPHIKLQLQPVSMRIVGTPSDALRRHGDVLARKQRLRNYTKHFYEVGQRGDRSQFVLFIIGESTPPQGPPYVLVGIVDVTATGILTAQTYLQRSNGQDLFAELMGVADTDGDGLADVVLIYHGDFYGDRLFLKKSGQWHLHKSDFPGPC